MNLDTGGDRRFFQQSEDALVGGFGGGVVDQLGDDQGSGAVAGHQAAAVKRKVLDRGADLVGARLGADFGAEVVRFRFQKLFDDDAVEGADDVVLGGQRGDPLGIDIGQPLDAVGQPFHQRQGRRVEHAGVVAGYDRGNDGILEAEQRFDPVAIDQRRVGRVDEGIGAGVLFDPRQEGGGADDCGEAEDENQPATAGDPPEHPLGPAFGRRRVGPLL